ncbi:MAG: PAS domain S-box protein [Desulfobacterales bacterium]|nr:PAS domain S-box protein [Desulfobacterales bacterium]
MKEQSEDERTIERAIFADRLARFVLFPFLFGIAVIAYTKGIPYPLIPIGIVLVAYYITAQITIVLIKRNFCPKWVYLFRLIISMVLTAIAVHYTGGIESPLFILLGISFIMSALILPLKQSIFVFVVGGVAYLAEIWLEHYGIIPHIHIVNAFSANAFQDTTYLLIFSLVIVTVLAGMGTLTGYLIRFLNLQLEELREAKTHTENLVKVLEEARVTLEDKVKERTREIAESEEKYRNIVDKSFDGIYIVQDDVFKFVNTRFEEITGYTAEELKHMDFRELIAPESLELVSERGLKRQRGEKVPENYEFVELRKDGKKIDVEVFATTINYKGRLAVQAYIRDITEKKILENEIRETRDLVDSILQSSADAIVAVDRKGIVTFASKGAEEMLGYRESWIGTHTSKYYAKGMEKAKELEGIVREKEKLENYEIDYIAEDGRIISAIVSASLLRDVNGKVIGSLGVAKDITEKKKLENETREVKNFLENIIESSIDGITTTNNKGVITFASKGAEEMLGYRREETIGTHIYQYYLNGREDARKIMKVLGKDGRLQNYEIDIIAKDGRIVPINTSASLIRDNRGKTIGTMGVYKDITEKKRLEEEIRRRNEELENFVYTVSHDLKSPLVSLQGFASILLSDYKDKIDENGQHYLERIGQNASYMETLTQDLLELSKVGRVVGAFEKVDTSKIIEELTGRVQHLLEEKKIELLLRNHFPIVYCDRNRILQVFENLISNSIKFMGDAESPVIEIGHTDKGEVYEFYVRDNGIGIEKKYHEKIFIIFQRLQDLEGVEGTGVGLAIIKRIVENHGGNIWVGSEKGKGATFHFTLPKRNLGQPYTLPKRQNID